jgi:hypothetical protein
MRVSRVAANHCLGEAPLWDRPSRHFIPSTMPAAKSTLRLKRPDMSVQEFMNYYENQRSQLAKRMGAIPSLPNAQRYSRR